MVSCGEAAGAELTKLVLVGCTYILVHVSWDVTTWKGNLFKILGRRWPTCNCLVRRM
jgi:hypothetical protein